MYDSNLIISKGVSVTDYFKQKMQAKLNQAALSDEEKQKKKKKRKHDEDDVPMEDETAEVNDEDEPVKKSKKKKKKTSDEEEQLVEAVEKVSEEPPKKKKKSKKARDEEETEAVQEVEAVEEPSLKVKKKKKSKKEPEIEEIPAEPVDEPSKSSKKKKKNCPKQEEKSAGEPERGANAVYSTNVIQIPSHVAQKLSSMSIDNFKNANLANVVGYGLSEDIEIKTVQTKIGQNTDSTDKYSLYNMDRMTTRQRVNPRKIISKLKRTKKSIQVI